MRKKLIKKEVRIYYTKTQAYIQNTSADLPIKVMEQNRKNSEIQL